jgi:hypothetical protein
VSAALPSFSEEGVDAGGALLVSSAVLLMMSINAMRWLWMGGVSLAEIL